MKIVPQSATYMTHTRDALYLIESAGRTCYKSEAKITEGSAEKFVRMIVKRGHDSVLEHASATFRIITDRGISHEIVRHRIACSYSQESTRYVKYCGDMEFIEPPGLRELAQEEWMRSCENAEETYKWMIDAGYPPQIARSVLPNCLKTEITMSANFRAWRYFFKLRCSSGAHPQIQEIANMIKLWFTVNYPVIVEDL